MPDPARSRPTTHDDVLDVVVLAGGRGRRMGTDKALLRVQGRRQVDHVVAALRPLGGRVVLAGGSRRLDVPATVEVDDDTGLAGPLAGLVAGLVAARTELVAVAAVDLVAPDVALLRALAAHVDAHRVAGAMPMVGRWPQPLHAVLRRDRAGALRTAGGRSVGLVAALDAVGVVRVPEATWRRWAPQARPGDDLDTPADVARLRRTTPPAPPTPFVE